MPDNLIPIDGGATKDKAADETRKLKASLPAMIENVQLIAELTHAKYLALRKAGFTESQALELCKTL